MADLFPPVHPRFRYHRRVGSDAITADLSHILDASQILGGHAASRGYDCDAYTVDRSAPSVVVLPQSTEEVAKIVSWCLKRSIPFTARGAGTGLSGGALPALGGVVISTKRMTKILRVEVEDRYLIAQTGATNKSLSDAVAAHHLHFAPDPSSGLVSTLGGNIAENSGGPHTLKYGVTVNHVLGLTLVDSEGEVRRFGGPAKSRPGPDFLSLLVGSEGTLGVVTEATVNLVPNPAQVATALIAFREIGQSTRTVSAIIESGIIPAALELMDRNILKAIKLAFGLEYPEDCAALLLIECDGDSAEKVRLQMDEARAIGERHGGYAYREAADETGRKELWRARKQGIGAMGRLAPSSVTHDGVIPRSKLPEMLDLVYEVAEKYQLGIANIFHAGDGNLHPCFYFDDREPGIIDRVVEAGELILRKCIDLGGSISGEHGVGVEKIDLMEELFGTAGLNLQTSIRYALNPGALCNPCKVIPNQKGCIEHKTKWRQGGW